MTLRQRRVQKKLIAQYDAKDKEALASEAVQVSVAGRIIRMRGPFTVIQDGAAQMQLYMNNKSLPEELVEEFKALDLGDIIGLEGELFKTGQRRAHNPRCEFSPLNQVAQATAG